MPGLKRKSGIGQTERYQRIKNNLNHPDLVLVMSVVVNVAKDFEHFLLPLQSEEPKIRLLYSKCINLIKATLVKYISVKDFTDASGSKLLEKN